EAIQQIVPQERLIIQSSSSLLHVPVTVETEETLETVIKESLAFADQKLDEIAALTKAVVNGRESVAAEIQASVDAITRLNESRYRQKGENSVDASTLNA